MFSRVIPSSMTTFISMQFSPTSWMKLVVVLCFCSCPGCKTYKQITCKNIPVTLTPYRFEKTINAELNSLSTNISLLEKMLGKYQLSPPDSVFGDAKTSLPALLRSFEIQNKMSVEEELQHYASQPCMPEPKVALNDLRHSLAQVNDQIQEVQFVIDDYRPEDSLVLYNEMVMLKRRLSEPFNCDWIEPGAFPPSDTRPYSSAREFDQKVEAVLNKYQFTYHRVLQEGLVILITICRDIIVPGHEGRGKLALKIVRQDIQANPSKFYISKVVREKYVTARILQEPTGPIRNAADKIMKDIIKEIQQ